MSTPPEVPGKAGGKLAAKAGGKRTILIAAAGGVALFAFLMSRANGGSGGGGTSQQQMTGYDSTPYDQYNALQAQLEDLQSQLDNGKVTPGTPATPAPTPASPKPKPTPLPWRPPTPKSPQPSRTTLPATAKKVVTIKSGDTLSGIAKKSGISMATLKKLNPVFWTNPKYDDGNKIWSGGKVRVK